MHLIQILARKGKKLKHESISTTWNNLIVETPIIRNNPLIYRFEELFALGYKLSFRRITKFCTTV